jgi:hypothetical protein
MDPRDDSPLTDAQRAGFALVAGEVEARNRAAIDAHEAQRQQAAESMAALEREIDSRRTI